MFRQLLLCENSGARTQSLSGICGLTQGSGYIFLPNQSGNEMTGEAPSPWLREHTDTHTNKLREMCLCMQIQQVGVCGELAVVVVVFVAIHGLYKNIKSRNLFCTD